MHWEKSSESFWKGSVFFQRGSQGEYFFSKLANNSPMLRNITPFESISGKIQIFYRRFPLIFLSVWIHDARTSTGTDQHYVSIKYFTH